MGTEREPIEIECPLCGGVGCTHCEDGSVAIDGCPNQYCREMVTPIRLIEHYRKGMPPVAGGVLDQSAWFLEAAETLEHDEALLKAERNQ